MNDDLSLKNIEFSLSQSSKWAEGQAISYLMKQGIENPDVLSLAAGFVDPATLPVGEVSAAFNRIFSDDSQARKALQYGTTAGAEKLRQQLIEHLVNLEGQAVSDLNMSADQLLVTTGSQQFLSLIGKATLNPGDICLVAAPTYFVFLGVLNGLGARTVPVHTDEQGMCMDSLETTLQQIEEAGDLDRVKMIYLVSYYENPSGVCLAESRRKQVVEIAQRWSKEHSILVLEDAAYRELHYDGPVYPSVWSHDASHETVALTQTFSKSFAPGLRVGYGVVPKSLIEPLNNLKGNEDFGSANIGQQIISNVFENDTYSSHVEGLCQSYRKKRDAMLSAIDKHLAPLPGVSWLTPHGGLYVWASLPDHVPTGFDSPLFHQATHVNKVMYVPGELCYANAEETNHMRLSYGVLDKSGIAEGIKRLAAAIRTVL